MLVKKKETLCEGISAVKVQLLRESRRLKQADMLHCIGGCETSN